MSVIDELKAWLQIKSIDYKIQGDKDPSNTGANFYLGHHYGMKEVLVKIEELQRFEEDRFNIMAEMAYKVSDAMLAEREK